jgi:prepilin-type N-terminal cleavage/methylation domain-containing protein
MRELQPRAESRLRSPASRGYSLTELLIVVALIAALATVALPSFSPAEDQKLDLAAALVAEALRHARSEALRTGAPHGVTINRPSHTVTVQKWNLGTTPASVEVVLPNPLGKQPHALSFSVMPSTANVTVANDADVFLYDDLVRRDGLMFDGHGTPIWVVTAVPTTHLLEDGDVQLRLGDRERHVRVARLTGRVTIE